MSRAVPPDPTPATAPSNGAPFEDVRGRNPRTKIVCTLGPACREVTVLADMVRAGADVFRVNGAHARPEEIAGWIDRVRRAGEATGAHPAVLMDLPGTKIRVGALPRRAIDLRPGNRVRLIDAPRTDTGHELPVPMPYFHAVPVGSEVLLQDGRIRLVVLEAGAHGVVAEVREGGSVSEGTGVHFRAVSLPTTVPTEKDRRLLVAAVAAGADLVSQSFVRSGAEMATLREMLRDLGAPQVLTIAKIERLDAVNALDEILDASDGAMVARGDLGVDALPERVPSLQLRILEAGARRGCPVIVATEMLESMTTRGRPTRAEATDVAAAVLTGADAVMLSGETAVGEHPVLVVETMARILSAVEQDPIAPYAGSAWMRGVRLHPNQPDEYVVRAAVNLAQDMKADAIGVYTRTGASALRLAKERPAAPIFAFAPSEAVCRRLSIAWGVGSTCLPSPEGTGPMLAVVEDAMRRRLRPGSHAILVMGGADEPAGSTTLIKLVAI